MSLTQFLGKIKSVSSQEEGETPSLLKKTFLSMVVILVASLSFGLGRLSVPAGNPIKVEYDPSLSAFMNQDKEGRSQTASALNALKPTSEVPKAGFVVGSSKGTKYHYPHCPGAKQISEANKVTFNSKAEAEASGYTLAANCRPN